LPRTRTSVRLFSVPLGYRSDFLGVTHTPQSALIHLLSASDWCVALLLIPPMIHFLAGGRRRSTPASDDRVNLGSYRAIALDGTFIEEPSLTLALKASKPVLSGNTADPR
jgi:hypothetical protein